MIITARTLVVYLGFPRHGDSLVWFTMLLAFAYRAWGKLP